MDRRAADQQAVQAGLSYAGALSLSPYACGRSIHLSGVVALHGREEGLRHGLALAVGAREVGAGALLEWLHACRVHPLLLGPLRAELDAALVAVRKGDLAHVAECCEVEAERVRGRFEADVVLPWVEVTPRARVARVRVRR